jgi:hypothetical protein
MVDSVSGWLPWSPFQRAPAEGPRASGLPIRFSLLVLGALVVISVAAPVFARRDIRVG